MNLNRLMPVALAAALAISWLMRSNNGFKLSLSALLVYGAWVLAAAISRAASRRARRKELQRMPVFSVQGSTLRMRPPNGPELEASLDDLGRVLILTTDQGPFVCDSFLILWLQNGDEWRVALEYPCYQAFYDALSERLPLDTEQTLMAAFSTSNAVFPLWERKEES